jgi:hypothetical protein
LHSLLGLNSNPFKGLGGKTIGLNILGGAREVAAKLIFKHFGLDPDREIKFLANGPLESRFAAVRQGLTAGTLGSPPTDFLGKKMGFVVLARAHELFSYLCERHSGKRKEDQRKAG